MPTGTTPTSRNESYKAKPSSLLLLKYISHPLSPTYEIRAAQTSTFFPPDKLRVKFFAVTNGKLLISISLGSIKLPRALTAFGPHKPRVAISCVLILISAFKPLSSL